MRVRRQGAVLSTVLCLAAGSLAAQTRADTVPDDPDARPPVTPADLQIVRRARVVLATPANWNRADDRRCPADARTVSLYCALERATIDVGGRFAHRGAAMQEVRFVIDSIAPHAKAYHHRLMDYNNDPTTTFADIQTVFRLLETRVAERLREQPRAANDSAPPTRP